MMGDQQAIEPIEQLRTRASSLSSTLDSVRTKTSMSEVFAAMEGIDSRLGALPGKLTQVRSRGYVFKCHLEDEVTNLRYQWPSTRPRVEMDADEQRRLLIPQLESLQARFVDARAMIDTDMGQAESALTALAGATENLGKTADTALSSLRGRYDSLQDRLSAIEGDVTHMEAVLKRVDEASFKLYPEENVIETIEAQWLTDQKGGPKGVLFCTDHRLIFEQKEEIATKRVLFIVTEKQKVQQVALEAPIGAALQVKESESGALLFRKDHLELTFGPQSRVRAAHFILKGDSAAWQRLINRVNAGEMVKEQVLPESRPVATEKPKGMPMQCPACGGRFTQELVRGMQSVKCQYCGTVVPLQG
jgi:hypothetical protein